jgi:hypothetical protein
MKNLLTFEEFVNESKLNEGANWYYTLASIQDEIKDSEQAKDWPEMMDAWKEQAKAITKYLGGNEKSISHEQSEGNDGHDFLTALYGEDGDWYDQKFTGLKGKTSTVISTMMGDSTAIMFSGEFNGIKYILIDDRDAYSGPIIAIYVANKDVKKLYKELGIK